MIRLPIEALLSLMLTLEGNLQSEITIDRICLDNVLDLSPLCSLIIKSNVNKNYFVVLIELLGCKIIGRIRRINPIWTSINKHVQHKFTSFGIKSIDVDNDENKFRLNLDYEYSLYIFINNSSMQTERNKYRDWAIELLGKREAILLLENHLTSLFIKDSVMQMYFNQTNSIKNELLKNFQILITNYPKINKN